MKDLNSTGRPDTGQVFQYFNTDFEYMQYFNTASSPSSIQKTYFKQDTELYAVLICTMWHPRLHIHQHLVALKASQIQLTTTQANSEPHNTETGS